MRKLNCFILLIVLSCSAGAQSRKMQRSFGFQTQIMVPIKQNLPRITLGIPSFSYGASLERRFTLHNKLKFSYNYSLNYFRFQTPKNEVPTLTKMKLPQSELSAGIGVNAIYQFRKQSCILTGFTMNKPVYTCFKVNTLNEDPTQPVFRQTERKFTLQDLNRWNATFMIGIERSMQLFKKELAYSLQYHFGFRPEDQFNEKVGNPLMFQHGIQIGIKYNY
jgi:hypothetical protein